MPASSPASVPVACRVSAHPPPPCLPLPASCPRSIDILGGQGWSYGAIPFIYIFMVLIRTGCMALFNLTAFRWIKEREWRRFVCCYQIFINQWGRQRCGMASDATFAQPRVRRMHP